MYQSCLYADDICLMAPTGTALQNNLDYKDLLRQMWYVYARSNMILRMFSHCSIYVKIVVSNIYCTPL